MLRMILLAAREGKHIGELMLYYGVWNLFGPLLSSGLDRRRINLVLLAFPQVSTRAAE